MEIQSTNTASRLRKLADSLDCLTGHDLALLTNATENTVESWRKRGKGPDYLLVGNRFFQPRQAVAAYFTANVRQRNQSRGKDLL